MTAKTEQRTYRQIRAELDEAMAWFESETIDVDEAIAKYKHAMALTKELEVYLKDAENSLIKLNVGPKA